MATPALLLAITDARELRAALADRRRPGALTDARELRGALALAPLPELGVGAVYVVTGRIPMVTSAGTHAVPGYGPTRWRNIGSTVQVGPLASAAAVLASEPHWYVPGPLRPAGDGVTRDVFRVSDGAGVVVDVTLSFNATWGPAAQALDVPIGTDGVAALSVGGTLALTASGGAGPYVWDFAANRSGATLTPDGAYVAGPAVGIDRVRVTDANGDIGLAQLEVVPGAIALDLTGLPAGTPLPYSVIGNGCLPYARLLGPGGVGVAPYTIAMLVNETGGSIVPARGERAQFRLTHFLDGSPVDLTGWTFEAKLYSQRGAVMADGLAVAVVGNVVEAELPSPDGLPLDLGVLRVTATTAGAVATLGYLTTSFEMLLLAPEA